MTHRKTSRALLVLLVVLSTGCATAPTPPTPAPDSAPPASTHPVATSPRGTPTSYAAMEAVLDAPGPLALETVSSARWEVPRSGLINLDNSEATSLVDGPEPIAMYFHAITHPSLGLYIVDTGAEAALAAPDHPARTSPVGQAFGLSALHVETSLGAWLGQRSLAGVLLTHLHLDHLLGLPDVPADVPVFTGPGEAAHVTSFNALTQPAVDALFAGRVPMRAWNFRGSEVLDAFEDGSLFVLRMEGHTPGSVAFVARTTHGPVLLTGDTCHTAWGWDHVVEPGTFTHDAAKNRASLLRLRALADRHPSMTVRLGHQPST